MLVQCIKGKVKIETPELLPNLPCPNDCPKKSICKSTWFSWREIRGKKEATITNEEIVNFLNNKDKKEDSNPVVKEEPKVEYV